MKKTAAVTSVTLAASVSSFMLIAWSAGAALGHPEPARVALQDSGAGQQPAAPKQPQWKSREEYDAFNAMASEKDLNKRISLAEAFAQKFANSDFKSHAYVAEMQAYAQLNNPDKAVQAAQKGLEADADNVDALVYLSYVFPFAFKLTDPDAEAKLSRADASARHGLEVLQKLQKPANVPDDQFNQSIKARRAIFNGGVGFVALQRKEYAKAVASFRAAAEDNPSDVYTFYRLGLAYLYSSPTDYDHAVWYISRAVSLAKASQNPAGQEIERFLKRAYVNYHGNEEGLADVIAQAAGAPNPPEGFKVAPMEKPTPTGNPNIDGFNTMTFPLKLGGEKAQQTWDQLKGQAVELGGFVDSVGKADSPGAFLVRIDILQQSKAADGVYDIELKDTTQADVMNLSKGDPVTFKGTLGAYTATPGLMLSVDGEITTPLPDKPAVKEKPKPVRKTAPPARRRPAARRTQG